MSNDNIVKSNVEGLELYSEAYPFRLSLRVGSFESEGAFQKFVKNCELMLRKSLEYKLWRNYIIDVLQVNQCMITHEVIGEVTVDIHHHIPSLHSFITALVNECLEKGEEFCSFDICQKAIILHFQNKVGYVALMNSMHDKFHNGHLDIPISFVKGDYMFFVNNYLKYLDDAEKDVINTRLAVSTTNVSWSRNNYPAAASM
jgi:hypothetical protein